MSNTNKKLLIVVIILAVILIAVIAIFAGFYLGSKDTPVYTPTPDSSVGTSQGSGKDDFGGDVNKGKSESSSESSSGSGSGSGNSTGSTSSVTVNVAESSTTESSTSSSTPKSESSTPPESSTDSSKAAEKLTTRQILDSSMYWADESGKYGFAAQAKGEYEVLLDDEVYHTLQIITVDEDKIDGFTYNMIMELENYSTGVISTIPLYCHQMDYGKGIHIQLMMWDGSVKYLEPSDVDPFQKFAQNP